MEVLIKDLGLLINAILIATPPLLLAALGSCFSERSGVVNIGIEGMMTIGAFVGACVAYFSGNGWLGFFAGGLSSAVLGVIHATMFFQHIRWHISALYWLQRYGLYSTRQSSECILEL